MRSSLILVLLVLLFACNTTSSNEVIDGILEVPENRKKSNSRTLKLVYKVLKAKKANTQKAPIVFLQGGPGGPTVIEAEFWKNHPLRNNRDIILMDQRGTGASEANCIEIGDAMFTIMRQDLDNEGEIRALNSIFSECKKSMKKDEVDLAGYTSKENAADFEDLRKALGYEKWNLFGVSYGSRLGLTIMRDFPNSIRSTVFTGIFAPETDILKENIPNLENSLFTVLERCEKNENCNKRYPNLKERLLKAIKKLQSDPLHFDYEGKLFVLNRQDALTILILHLYDRRSIGNIPLLIEAFENGETESLLYAIKAIENLSNYINWPMNYSVMAYEELPFYDELAMIESIKRSEIAFNLSMSSELGIGLLKNWHSYRASEIENQAVVSEIPTLMVSGGLDHVTPVSNAKEAIKHLKNGYELIFSDEGHNLFNPCFFQIVEDFLNHPTQRPNTECSSEKKPIKWNLTMPDQKKN
ncbi:alpha/beta hydrolase [Algibacter sp. 2305UL17-15]|uniref:alpha/beta hydrolase n=1 Tax=Algibacter sp. 2305UL17-15 TaxID=3231268 RepID=UPI00345A2312